MRMPQVVCFTIAALLFPTVAALAEQPETGVVLDMNNTYWRCFSVRGSEAARSAAGKLQFLYEFKPVLGRAKNKSLNKKDMVHTDLPPDDWRKTNFDDSSWARQRGSIYAFIKDKYQFKGTYFSAMLLCLRGKFTVDDPAAAKDMHLNLTFQGGIVVYLNGKEITRAHMPRGKLDPWTPAEDYPLEAYVNPDNQLLTNRGKDIAKHADRFAKRSRGISGITIPASMFQKGVNVLAIEVHRAAAPEIMFLGRTKKLFNVLHIKGYCWWNRIGIEDVSLFSKTHKGIQANTQRPKGLQIWNHPVIRLVRPSQYGDPNEPLRPVRIVGARNGTYSGVVVVSSTGPINGINATVTDLKGPGVLKASDIQIRYALKDGSDRRGKRQWFDGLEEFPPGSVAVGPKNGAAIQPVWFTVHVPEKAAPGLYEGHAVIRTSKTSRPVQVPIKLTVLDWTLPNSTDFKTHVGLVQSPETLAMQYNVPLWSDRHWKLVEKSLRLLGQVGNKTIYITLIRRSHFGNEHSMVRWVRQPDGSLKPDLAIAEKYIELAVKHMGRIPVVGLYCWEPSNAPAHFPAGAKNFSPGDRDILITTVDPKTGELKKEKGPKWGTPECGTFWKKALGGIMSILKKHGLEKSAMLGIACDYSPTRPCADDLAAAVPNASWIMHCHPYRTEIHKRPVGSLASVWGIFGTRDPAAGPDYYGNTRFHGWRNPFRVVAFPRAGNPVAYIGRTSPSELFRLVAEKSIVSQGRPNAKSPGVRGFGRLGADFWPVIKAKVSGRAIGRGQAAPLCGRFPDSHAGGMAMTYVSYYVLSPGKEGAISSNRFEMIREGLQEAEARIFISEALLDPEKRAKLGSALVKRCWKLLDDRVRMIIRSAGQRGLIGADWLWYGGLGWRKQSQKLYITAAEVAEALEKNSK